jgi:3-dehydroquinate synthase
VSRERIDVTTPPLSTRYPIVIASDQLDALGSLLDDVGFPRQRIVISSPRVWRFHGGAVSQAMAGAPAVLVPDGERAKTTRSVARIHDALIEHRADRGAGIVAVGGGVIGDVAGFAAATYLRGIPIAHVPTTLLAQVDSAVGGKVGVNHAVGKNLIGAFHQPALVAIDPTVLTTLTRREFRAGLYEVVKYGAAFDATLFDEVGAELRAIFARDMRVLTGIIATSCRIKARVVMEDERERGPRRLLNFGHTAGHAFEAVTEFRRFRHGEAIAWGMLVAGALSAARGVLDTEAQQRLTVLITALGPLPPVSDLALDAVLAAIRRDKKVVQGRLHFVVATGLGRARVVDDVEEDELREALARVGVGGGQG